MSLSSSFSLFLNNICFARVKDLPFVKCLVIDKRQTRVLWFTYLSRLHEVCSRLISQTGLHSELYFRSLERCYLKYPDEIKVNFLSDEFSNNIVKKMEILTKLSSCSFYHLTSKQKTLIRLNCLYLPLKLIFWSCLWYLCIDVACNS